MNFKLIHHHVGARGNVRIPLESDSPLRADFSAFYYDADPDALSGRLTALVKVGEVRFLPYCIGSTREKRTFLIGRNPTASSLYRLNPRYRRYTNPTYLGQMPLENEHAVEREVSVDLIPLDDICEPTGEYPPPDYLSMDVEGAEYEVFRGAETALSTSVLWLEAEMWFNPVYDSAATISTNLGHLAEKGFDTFKVEPTNNYEADSLSYGMHGDGQTFAAEVAVHKRLDMILSQAASDPKGTLLRLYKLAFLAVLNGGNGLCFRCLKEAEALGGDFFADSSGNPPAKYLAFLRGLSSRMQKMADQLPKPPYFGHHRLARTNRKHAFSIATSEADRRRLIEEDRKAQREVKELCLPLFAQIHRVQWAGTTSLELYFQEFGLIAQSQQLQARRKELCETFFWNYYRLSQPEF